MTKLKSLRIKQYKKLLLNYKNFNLKQQQWFLDNLSDDFIKCIIEILLNVNENNIEITEDASKVLRRYNKLISKLLSPSLSIEKRKKLIQKGLFLHTFMNHLAFPVIEKLLT